MTRAARLREVETCYGTISIGGVAMDGLAWAIQDYSDLYGTPDQRGADVLIPGDEGLDPKLRRVTASRYSFPLMVVGRNDRFGALYGDPYAGLQANIAYLNANVLLPTGTGDGTRSLVWTTPSGATKTTDVHVLPFKPRTRPGAVIMGSLELSVPHPEDLTL